MVNVIGIIPARMQASRLPGKPLMDICGLSMIQHVYTRASMYKEWNKLFVACCDAEIAEHCENSNINYIMTSPSHDRALDRVAEAAAKIVAPLSNSNDVIVCVQGDEPMLAPYMIDKCVEPIVSLRSKAVMVTMDINSNDVWLNPNVVKVVANERGEVVYTSRAPIPYSKHGFQQSLGAQRIYGIFGFTREVLDIFTKSIQTRLELLESCDSNRIFDLPFTQNIARLEYSESFAVDTIEDLEKVRAFMPFDKLYQMYKVA